MHVLCALLLPLFHPLGLSFSSSFYNFIGHPNVVSILSPYVYVFSIHSFIQFYCLTSTFLISYTCRGYYTLVSIQNHCILLFMLSVCMRVSACSRSEHVLFWERVGLAVAQLHKIVDVYGLQWHLLILSHSILWSVFLSSSRSAISTLICLSILLILLSHTYTTHIIQSFFLAPCSRRSLALFCTTRTPSI